MPRKLGGKMSPPDVRSVWVSDNVLGNGTYGSPLDFGGGGSSDGNVDGGQPDSVYGGSIAIDGGGP